jgi:hypothetical protein
MDVIRRTFAAAGHPEGSEERARLNEDPATSEYMPSYRWLAADRKTFRTRGLAQAYVDTQPRCAGCGEIQFARIHVPSRSGTYSGGGHAFTAAQAADTIPTGDQS